MKRVNRHILILGLWLMGFIPLYGQLILKTPKDEQVLEKHRISVTIAGKPGAKAWIYINDVLADSGEIRIDGKYDFLNIDVPEGPVEIRTEAVGAGNRIFKATRQVHVVGSPDTLIVDKTSVKMPADSQSVETIHVQIQDAWGYPINRIKTATVRIEKGSIVEPDIDSLSAGWQLPVNDSRFSFQIKSSKSIGQEDAAVNIGDLFQKIHIRYTTPSTDFILVGSLDAAASAAQLGDKDADTPKFTLADWTYQEEKAKNIPVSGRLAFYAKGSIREKYLLTASFDSRRTRDNQLFRDMDPNQQYALYGDASTLIYDAQTQSKFYGKIERNESFVLMGDFNTGFMSTEFAKYNRSFMGIYSQIHAGVHAFTAFGTLNDRTMKLDEIRGEGISGYYYLTASQITLNSDKIRIETRDRYHPEKILRSDELVRYMDYDINYTDGTLMFKQAVPSADSEGNPVYIVAVYEYQANSAKSLIGGFRYEGSVKGIKLGSTLIVEEKEPSNYYMYGADVAVPVGKWLQVKGEIAQTHASDFSNEQQIGQAYSTVLEFKPFKTLNLKGYYRRVESNFLNPSQTGSQFEVGTEKYGASQSLDIGKIGKIRSEFYRQFNGVGTVNEYHVQVANAFYEYAISKKTTARLGYEDAERKNMEQDSIEVRGYRSKMIRGQISHQWNKRLSTEFEHEQNLTSDKTTLPTGTSLGLTFNVSEKVNLFLKQRLLNTSARKTQTIFGINSKINRNTIATGKYEIGGAGGENLNRATIGLKNKWEVRKDMTLNIAFESSATIDSLEVPTPDHNSLSIGFEYLPDKPWKSSGKYEIMQDKIVRKQVITLGSEVKILNGLSAIGKLECTGAKYYKSLDDVWNRSNYQLGLAYRPERQDAFNGIVKFQLLTDKNTHVAPQNRLDRLIVSSHGYWQASSNLEFGFRFALRRLLDEETGFFKSITTTSLYSIRGEYEWHQRWFLGMDLRLVSMYPIQQVKTGAAGEVGYVFKKDMMVGIGYLFKQLEDADFSYDEYNYANFYIVLRMKFSEDIFDWR